ncbi:hypothetical protein UlMin_039600 [Ulmus minor]
MGFWTLLEVASMPIVQVLLISLLGAFMATDYCNLLPADARKSLNKIVFVVFTPALMFANLAGTVTLEDIISWWFMPVNIGLTFLFGGILGWIVVKILRPKPHLEGLIIATCSSGNLGNLLLIIVPAICNEDGSPFGDTSTCKSIGLSYASFSMALGGFFIWTYTYHLMRTSSAKYKALEAEAEAAEAEEIMTRNDDLNADEETQLLRGREEEEDHVDIGIIVASNKSLDDQQDITSTDQNQAIVTQPKESEASFQKKLAGFLLQIWKELLAPPTLGAILGLIFGTISFLRKLIIGDDAPLRVIEDSVTLLGEGTIPSITLILGGNLTRGLRSSKLKPLIVIAVVCARYILLPAIGIFIVKGAEKLGFLPSDPLFQFVLMIQFALPPAMTISTMTQLFDVGKEDCSVLFLWTYLAAALALTLWSTVFLWILS